MDFTQLPLVVLSIPTQLFLNTLIFLPFFSQMDSYIQITTCDRPDLDVPQELINAEAGSGGGNGYCVIA